MLKYSAEPGIKNYEGKNSVELLGEMPAPDEQLNGEKILNEEIRALFQKTEVDKLSASIAHLPKKVAMQLITQLLTKFPLPKQVDIQEVLEIVKRLEQKLPTGKPTKPEVSVSFSASQKAGLAKEEVLADEKKGSI